MTDDLHDRLRSMLAARAEQIEPTLSGPAVRARTSQPRGALRRIAPALSAAAAVIVVAVSAHLLGTHHTAAPPREHPGQGGPSVSTPVTQPPTSAAPSPSADRPSIVAPQRPTVGSARPSLPGTASVSSAPVLMPTGSSTTPTGPPPRPSTSPTASTRVQSSSSAP